MDVGVVLLQREIPEHVNLAVAAAAHHTQVPVVQVLHGLFYVATIRVLLVDVVPAV